MKHFRLVCAVFMLALLLCSCTADGDIEIRIDPSYISYENEDITDYLDPTAPFVSVGGNILYRDRAYFWSGKAKFYTNIAIMNGSTGLVHTVCQIANCIHNTLEETYFCDLCYLTSDLRVDDQGYIYGVYNDPELGGISVLRYNIYTAQTNHIYSPVEHEGEERRTLALDHVYLYSDKYVYFYEHMADGRVNLMRFEFSGRETVNLTPDGMPEEPLSFDIFERHIYILTASGYYAYDLDLTPASKYMVLSLDRESSPVYGMEIASIQFDWYMHNIYFIARSPGAPSGTLCKVRAYGDSYRRVRRTALTDVVTYQLTYDCIYYTRLEPILRCVGVETPFDFETGIHSEEHEDVEYYDYTGGKFYRVGYAAINEDVIEQELVFDTGEELYLANCTVIGSYMYGENMQLVADNIVSNKTDFIRCDWILAPVQRVRVNLHTGEVTPLDVITMSAPTDEQMAEETSGNP